MIGCQKTYLRNSCGWDAGKFDRQHDGTEPRLSKALEMNDKVQAAGMAMSPPSSDDDDLGTEQSVASESVAWSESGKGTLCTGSPSNLERNRKSLRQKPSSRSRLVSPKCVSRFMNYFCYQNRFSQKPITDCFFPLVHKNV
jgi:hypothetical protein